MAKKQISRRDFIKIIAVAGGGAAALKLGLGIKAQPVVVTETRLLMGMVVNLTIIGGDQHRIQQAIHESLDRMAYLENILSRFKENSEVSILNRQGRLNDANPALLHIIKESARLYELTGGAFDITIQPLVHLYKDHHNRNAGLPSTTQIEEILPLVNSQNINMYGSDIYLMNSGMAISVDGIAKGYIVDAGVSVLRSSGFENVMIEAGGDLFGSGKKKETSPWRVGVRLPRRSQANLLQRVTINNQAVATSGDYYQTYSEDFSVHHIIDPRSGYSAPELASATVVAPDTMNADALATSVMVLGVKDGIRLIEGLSECEAFLVTKDLQQYQTSGF